MLEASYHYEKQKQNHRADKFLLAENNDILGQFITISESLCFKGQLCNPPQGTSVKRGKCQRRNPFVDVLYVVVGYFLCLFFIFFFIFW